MLHITESKVNLKKCPAIDEKYLASTQSLFVFGDLHGNVLKLIYSLVRHGCMQITEDDYAKIVSIYFKPAAVLAAQDIQDFKHIIQRSVIKPHVNFCFLGDDLADRGSNDYFMLLLLQGLHEAQVNFCMLLSNHNLEFIKIYLTGFEQALADGLQNSTYFKTSISVEGQDLSLQNLGCLLSRGLIDIQEINALMQTVYLPHLRLLDYVKQVGKNTINLITHAPNGLAVIKALAAKYSIVYQDDNVVNLATTIDRINSAFQQSLIMAPKQAVYFKIKGDVLNINAHQDALKCLTWNRLTVYSAEGYQMQEMLHLHNHYTINYISGHNANGLVFKSYKHYVFNLDNSLGKFMADTNQTGDYSFIFFNSDVGGE